MKTLPYLIAVMTVISIFFSEGAKSQNYIINYSVPDLDPQSIVYYPAKKKFIVSSASQGQIGFVDDKGKYKLLLKDPVLMGASRMLISENFLYVLTTSSNASEANKLTQCSLVKLNLKSKAVISVTEFGKLHSVPFKTSTDLTIDDGGTIYIVNNSAAVIYRVKPDGTTSVLLANKALTQTKSIIYHTNGYLIVAADRYLYKIDLSTSNFTKVFMEDDFEEINSLHFSPNHLLILAEGGNINKLHMLNSSDSWVSANLLRTDTASYINPTSIEFADNKIYILDSKLQNSLDTKVEPGEFSVHVVDLQLRPYHKRRKGTVTAGELEVTKK